MRKNEYVNVYDKYYKVRDYDQEGAKTVLKNFTMLQELINKNIMDLSIFLAMMFKRHPP